MRDLLVAAIVFGALPFVFKRPFWGIILLAGLGYMNPHRLCYGFMYATPVVMIVFLVTLVGILASKEEPKKIVWSPEIVVLVIFIIWMGVTTTQAFYPQAAIEQYVKVIKIQILTFMTLIMLTSVERLKLLMWAIVLSLGFYGVKGGIFTITKGGVHRVQGPPGTFIEGNNELALALVMTIPLMRFLQLQEKRKSLKTVLASMMLLTAIAAVGSQSRGAMVALAVTGTIFWVKSRNKIVTGILIAIAALAALTIMPDEYFERMRTIKTYNEDASALGRINAWWTAFNCANARITGGGFEMWSDRAFDRYAPDPTNVRDVHSIYFEVLGEHGWIGFAIWATLIVLTWLKCGSMIRMSKKIGPEAMWGRDLGQMIQVSFVAYLSAGAFLGLAYFDYIYHLIAVVVVGHQFTKTRYTDHMRLQREARLRRGGVSVTGEVVRST